MSQPETKVVGQRTEVIRSAEEAAKVAIQVFSSAEIFWHSVSEANAMAMGVEVELYRNLYKDLMRRQVKVRALSEITKENVHYAKELLSQGLVHELRHLEGIRGNFTVSEKEYLAVASIEEHSPVPELIYSNDKQIVAQNQFVFDTLWKKAISAESKIKEIEQGVVPEITRVVDDLEEVMKIGERISDETKDEVLMILASDKVILRNRERFERLAKRQKEFGLTIRVLAPSISSEAREILPGALWHKTHISNVTTLIHDRKQMFLVQYADVDANSTGEAVSTNIYTTSRHNIAGIVSVFEALWHESELREKEQKSRRQAELLQDILAHDIRNFSQISLMNAEVLMSNKELSAEERSFLIDEILKAEGRTAKLVEKAKKLGKIISEETPTKLYPVNVKDSLVRSIEVVSKSQGVPLSKQVLVDSGASVLADDFLDEVFTNLLSNSVSYSEKGNVQIGISVSRAGSDWKISISDHGTGVPDELKEKLFTRYLDNSHGSGLGLSIVYALVVDRYSGKVLVRDRIQGDRSKGTVVEVFLRAA
jgi:two-component system, OmpR family, sensor histidine kinase VicK